MTVREHLYDAAVHASRPFLSLAGLASPKAGRAAAGRRTSASSLAGWGEEHRATDRSLVWLHGASAGELAGAGPILERLRDAADFQLAVTYSSPSAEAAAGRLRPDVADFAPLDTLRDTGRALRSVRPDCIVFAKTDVWPGLTAAAHRCGVPLALVNGTVDEGSSRLGGSARFLLAPAYGRLDLAGAATEEDARRLERIGVYPERIRVTGDAALDAALERTRGAEESVVRRRLEGWRPDGLPLILGGSTWPSDEDLLLGALRSLLADGCPAALVLVPHEPGEEHVGRLSDRCRALLGTEPDLWSEGPDAAASGEGPNVLVVDAVGILAELYGAADVTYVGGGLGGDGLHSVVEPAAAGVPVLFGPRHDRWEAGRLLGRGAAREVVPDSAAGVLAEILGGNGLRAEMAGAARAFVQEGAGAAAAGAALVRELLGGSGDR